MTGETTAGLGALTSLKRKIEVIDNNTRNITTLQTDVKSLQTNLTSLQQRVGALENTALEYNRYRKVSDLGFTQAQINELLALNLPNEQYDLVHRYVDIGYTWEDIMRVIDIKLNNADEAFALAKQIKDGWDATQTSYSTGYVNGGYYASLDAETKLEVFPKVDTSAVTNMQHLFFRCRALKALPLLDTSKVTNMFQTFFGNTSLRKIIITNFDLRKVQNFSGNYQDYDFTEVDELVVDIPEATTVAQNFSHSKANKIHLKTTSKLKDMSMAFYYMPMIKEIKLDDTSGVTNWENAICGSYADNIERIETIDLKSAGSMYEIDGGDVRSKLRYMKIRNLGYKESSTSFGVRKSYMWGTGSEENRQTLIDSLLTDSYDRAAAGYATFTLTLHQEILNRLTDDEKAAITAKGFTLTN